VSTSLRTLAVSLYFYVTLIRLCINISPEQWSPLILQFTHIGRLHSRQNSSSLQLGCIKQLLMTLGFSANSDLLCLAWSLLEWWDWSQEMQR